MRADLWRRLTERFGAGVLEFYAATTENIVLANASGAKVGAIGRPLPGSAELDIVRVDLATRAPRRDENGRIRRASTNEPGLGIARVPPARADDRSGRILRDVFEAGDTWFASQDLLKKDDDGDIWFVDRLSAMIRTERGFVSTRRIEDALYRLPEVHLAACVAVPEPVAFVVSPASLDPARIARALAEDLAPDERPRAVHRVAAIPMTEGFQPNRLELRAGSVEIVETLRPT
jgi:putative long chain acyl-CoA synthase